MHNIHKSAKAFLRKYLSHFSNHLDTLLSIVITPPAYLLYLFRLIGPKHLPKTNLRLKKIGVYPIIDHYYEPLFNDTHLSKGLEEPRYLPGLDLNINNQQELLTKLLYSQELEMLKLNQASTRQVQFSMGNGSFDAGDAEFLYQIIRKNKPTKIIEIGCGHSTKIARLAIERNKQENMGDTTHICIEPYEQTWLEEVSGITLIRERIEQINLDWQLELKENDLLFIDSSHIIRPQGDVLTEYLQIIPRLSKGVYVHVHDIFTPNDYLRNWLIEEVRFWNEQYLLEALLANSSRYEIVASLNYLKHHHYNELLKICPYLTKECEPGSFYFKIK